MLRRILLACVFAGLAACTREDKGAHADRKLVRYLPSNPSILAGVDVHSLVASPLYQRHRAQLDGVRQGSAGFDPRRDVQDALVAWSSDLQAPVIVGKTDGNGAGLGHSPEKGVFIIGSDAGGGNSTIPAALKQKMELLPAKDQVWIVSDRPLPLDRVPLSSDMRSALSNFVNNIRAFAMGANADEGAHIYGEVICDSEAGAKRVHDALRGLIGMARLMTRDDQLDRLKVYDAIQVDQDHSVVRIHADWNQSEADAAIAVLRGVRDRARTGVSR